MLVMNTQLEVKATTQFTGYCFNSMVKFGGEYLGASSEGLFELGGALDAGESINAYFAPVTTDMGISRPKRLRSLFVGCEASGPFVVGVAVDQGVERTYQVSAVSGQQGCKVPVGRDGEGRYWEFIFYNLNGSDLSVDSLEVLPIVRPRAKAPREPFVTLAGSFPSFDCEMDAA